MFFGGFEFTCCVSCCVEFERVTHIFTQVNDQRRVMDNLKDDINEHWQALKPLFGIYSSLFVEEAFGILIEVVDMGINLIWVLMGFGLLSIVFFGPLAIFFSSLWTLISLSFFQKLVVFILYAFSIYWTFASPFIIIQYDPSLVEFAFVYLSVLFILYSILFPFQYRSYVV